VTGYVEERAAIIQHFLDGWSEEDDAPVEWPNRPFDPPENEPWLRLHIDNGDPVQLTIGGQKNGYRYPGLIFFQVFVPAKSGDVIARSLADKIGNLFRAAVFPAGDSGTIVCSTPRQVPVGKEEEIWYQLNCVVPFHRDTVQ
jgi:hypothetical protein